MKFKKRKQKLPRSLVSLDAKSRKAGKMKHKSDRRNKEKTNYLDSDHME